MAAPNIIIQKLKEKFLDIMALLIALAAFIVSFQQGNTQKKLEVLNKQPLLNIEFIKADSQVTAPMKGFLLKNQGFGPAIITSFKHYKNENAFQNGQSFHEWLNSDGISHTILMPFRFEEINVLNKGYVITNNTDGNIFILGTKQSNFFNTDTRKSMDSVIIEIEYKSISPFDTHIYYLRFCENFNENNLRERTHENIYERNSASLAEK